MSPPALLWFRSDLRLHDHAPLARLLAAGASPVPVYVLDPRQFAPTGLGFPKAGGHRAQFLLEGLADLRKGLQRLGSNLVIRVGRAEEMLPELARAVGATAVYSSEEVTPEELGEQRAVARGLEPLGGRLHLHWHSTLFHPDDTPFRQPHTLPDVFTMFRKAVEKNCGVRAVYPVPKALPPLPSAVDPGELPTLASLGVAPPPKNPRAVLPFAGGEQAALQRLKAYVWERDALRVYKETRNGLLGADYSSKLSPWLAQGSLSPRLVVEQVRRYERERVANDSTYWLVFELLWRDFFRLVARKGGAKLFHAGGLRGAVPSHPAPAPGAFAAWCEGRTGVPFVDANMRELVATGFMSNRGRQNVASFLVKDLHVDWRHGAAFFESHLLDYDPCSNYGNWNYVAGVGNDPREDRYFNVLKQASMYDPKGEYVRCWVPEVAGIAGGEAHEPWRLSPGARRSFGVEATYPKPLALPKERR